MSPIQNVNHVDFSGLQDQDGRQRQHPHQADRQEQRLRQEHARHQQQQRDGETQEGNHKYIGKYTLVFTVTICSVAFENSALWAFVNKQFEVQKAIKFQCQNSVCIFLFCFSCCLLAN